MPQPTQRRPLAKPRTVLDGRVSKSGEFAKTHIRGHEPIAHLKKKVLLAAVLISLPALQFLLPLYGVHLRLNVSLIWIIVMIIALALIALLTTVIRASIRELNAGAPTNDADSMPGMTISRRVRAAGDL